MNLDLIIAQLTRTPILIENLCLDLSKENSRWKPAEGKWSIVEIINHLYDEEREDFRRRVDLTLNYPGMPWPPIDPPGWVMERKYNTHELTTSLQAFADERQKSLDFLKDLSDPDWNKVYDYPKIGKISAGDLLLSWTAHDLLHIRQISMVRVNLLDFNLKPFSTRYALP